MTTIRKLHKQDAADYRMLRLRALKEEPQAFCTDYEDYLATPVSVTAEDIEKNYTAGAWQQTTLVGVTTLLCQAGKKLKHKASIVAVYVAPEARGNKIAQALIEHVLEAAGHEGIELVQLSTNSDSSNIAAQTLYKNLGFESVGIEKHILKLADGSYIDDMVMVKFLPKAAAS